MSLHNRRPSADSPKADALSIIHKSSSAVITQYRQMLEIKVQQTLEIRN